VDLQKEFNRQLILYPGTALVLIPMDTCDYQNVDAAGFNDDVALSNADPEKSECRNVFMIDPATNLQNHPDSSITQDMITNDAFKYVHSRTPVVNIETGFLSLDRKILSKNPEIIPSGITADLISFVYNELHQRQTREAEIQ
jgi:hypothetical protein